MKILAFGDLVENKDALRKLSELDLSPYEFAIFTGDILSMDVFKRLREQRVLEGSTAGTTQERRRRLKEEVEPSSLLDKEAQKLHDINMMFKKIGSKIPVHGVWGNADHAYIMSKGSASQNFRSLHLSPLQVDDIVVIGYEGRPKYVFEKDYENPTEHAFDEAVAQSQLSEALLQLKNRRVLLVTHAPPYGILDQVEPQYRQYAVGTYGEKAKDGHIGSLAFRNVDDAFKPAIHLFGHIHECEGITALNTTLMINTGAFGRTCRIVSIDVGKHPRAEFKQI